MTDPYELDDIWINAFAALGRVKLTTDKSGVFDGGAVADPDVGPIVALLRGDTPMPTSARRTLAELLAPGEPPLENWKLVPERIKHIDPIAKQIETVGKFVAAKETGKSAFDAARDAGKVERQVYRYRDEVLKPLGERLRGFDPKKDR
jgi:hypothetical protein